MKTEVVLGREELELVKAMSKDTMHAAEVALKTQIFCTLLAECDHKCHESDDACVKHCAEMANAVFKILCCKEH